MVVLAGKELQTDSWGWGWGGEIGPHWFCCWHYWVIKSGSQASSSFLLLVESKVPSLEDGTQDSAVAMPLGLLHSHPPMERGLFHLKEQSKWASQEPCFVWSW